MTQTPQDALPALSRPLAVSDVPPEGFDVEIVASESERAELAALNGLPVISSLEATLRARKWRGDGLEVDGELRARVRQTCVVSLEEFDSDIAEPIHLRFAPRKESPRSRRRAEDADGAAGPQVHDALGEDPPDELVGGEVDLGAVVSEFLTLALDPYPRKPGAAFAAAEPDANDNVSPFAALKAAMKQSPQD
jgi:hypothetical protein